LAKNDSTIILVSKDRTNVRQLNISTKKFLAYLTIFLAVFLVLGKFTIDVLIDFRYDSKVENLEKSNNLLKTRLQEMSSKVKMITEQLTVIESKDDEIRMIMGLRELDADVRDVGIGGASFDYNLADNVLDAQTAKDLNQQMVLIDKLEREVKLELKSFSDLIKTYHMKEDSIRHMPALHPVLEGRITSDFGMRLHPIFKRYRKHPGVDFAAKPGTPIYAAADGIVNLAKYNGGYGNCVFLDHRYGFETRYGHMRQILVRHGQRVKRGDKIGLIGQTGIATAPHLHFEVHYNGKEVNPRHYFFNDAELNRLAIKDRQ
jgi:murein DD-endopeptidase MepM/ murein hydrolase activator NlpD